MGKKQACKWVLWKLLKLKVPTILGSMRNDFVPQNTIYEKYWFLSNKMTSSDSLFLVKLKDNSHANHTPWSTKEDDINMVQHVRLSDALFTLQ